MLWILMFHYISLLKDEEKMVQAALGREFHISLGRTVPKRVHQIDSMVAMLRQKLQFQKRQQYLIDFNKWEVFVNDDKTRTFLSIENTTGGLPKITKQIQAVNEVYKLHNLSEFYNRFISCQCLEKKGSSDYSFLVKNLI
ncbi:putative U6 snRNA phosphodiesterase Usb1 [Helianthus anomalus]